jgi:hypothetical protein
VSTKWRDFIEAHTTFKRTNQQPYDVVFGVLVAKETYDVRANPNNMDLIEIKPPNEAKLRFVPDNTFKDPYGLIVSVDFSACDELETIDAGAFSQSPLFRVNLSGCSKLRSLGSSAFGNENRQITQIIERQRLRESGIVPTFVVRSHESFLSLSGCSALEEIGSNAFYHLKLEGNLDLSDCVALLNIGSSAFRCSRLSQLDLTSCVALKGIGFYAFAESMLRKLILSRCTALERIGLGAFCFSGLIDLDISGCAALLEIGDMSFSDAKLPTLDLSGCAALEKIGKLAFADSPLTKLDLRVPGRARPFRVGEMCFKSANEGICFAGEVLAPAVYY